MKKRSKKKIIIPIVIVLVLLFLLSLGSSSEVTLYEEEEAATRDIITYHNFSGNVEVDTSKNVVSQASQQVLQLLVEEGDEVKEGDVIAVLDSEALKQNIELRELALSTTELSNYYNKRDAQKNYEDYKANLDAGLNTQLNSAKSAMDNAYSAAYTAQRALDEAIATYEASEPYASSKINYEQAKAAYEELQAQGESADATALESAKSTYELAKQTMDAMEDAKDASVRTLSDTVLNAVNTYNTAVTNYDAAVASVNQTLETYSNAVNKVEGLSSTETSQKELDNLYSQLEDYTIKANMSGVITDLSIKEGSMVTAGIAVAEISDLSKMKISIKIDEYDILGVDEGKNVDIYIDAIESEYKGTITNISKKAITVGGVSYYTAEVEFAADELVRSGMSVEVKLVSKEAYGVVSVSMDALRYEKDNTAYVYVKDAEGKEAKRAVKVGITDGNYVEITEGIELGDIVLVTPQLDYMELMMQMNGM